MIAFLDRPASPSQITHGRRLWLYVLVFLILTFLIAPTLIVVPMSFTASTFLEFPPQQWSLRWYHALLQAPGWIDAARVSLTVAASTVLAATPLGIAAAYGLHTAGLRLGKAALVVLVAPMLVPHILIAIGLFFAYSTLNLLNTITGLVLAHTLLALPMVVVVVLAGLRSFDLSYERAARSLGASRLRAFWWVILPQIRYSVFAAMMFAFITSFDEVIISLFVATGPTSTLTRRMLLALRISIDPTIAAISTLLIVITTAIVLVASMLSFARRS